MIIRQLHRGCWNKDHETYSGKERNEGILRRRWTRTPARRQGRAQDRPHARHADLHLEERQSRRRKTVTLRLGRLNLAQGVLNSANPEVPNRRAARTFQF